MKIRKMDVEDLDHILYLEKLLFAKSAWNKDSFLYELHENQFASYHVLVNDKEEILGYIGFWLIYEQCQITTLGIEKTNQGKGYSYLLLNTCFALAKQAKCSQITLEVRVSNLIAIHLYETYGFEIVALRKNYYENKENAYLMMKELEVEG